MYVLGFFGHGDIVAMWNRGERTLQSMTESEIPRICTSPPYRIYNNIIYIKIAPPSINVYIYYIGHTYNLYRTILSKNEIGNPPPDHRGWVTDCDRLTNDLVFSRHGMHEKYITNGSGESAHMMDVQLATMLWIENNSNFISPRTRLRNIIRHTVDAKKWT